MKFDFTTIMDRKGKDALAVDKIPYKDVQVQEGFSVLPMWVADMNFATVPSVQKAMTDRIAHPAFGYFEPREEYFRCNNPLACEKEWRTGADERMHRLRKRGARRCLKRTQCVLFAGR